MIFLCMPGMEVLMMYELYQELLIKILITRTKY